VSETPRLLVVDDEEVVCQACRRILSRLGFDVDVSTDAQDGLAWARARQYGAVLLDVKMPKMDGIQFLQSLREAKPELPVLIMTGYPSVPSAAAAVRLGISDYIVKPFSSEGLTEAVQRVVHAPLRNVPGARAWSARPASGLDRVGETMFWDEAWLRLESDGSACVGAVIPGLRGATVEAVRLPRIGEATWQGLPLAGIYAEGRPLLAIPSPVSGVVAGVNDALARTPSLLFSDPCGDGWIACICSTRMEQEAGRWQPRRVILVNVDERSGDDQSGRLTTLGCHVRRVRRREELPGAVGDPDCRLVLLDGRSLGERGPEMVGRINSLAASMKVVVVASSDAQAETEYRKHRIFYYAVEPFADNEIADILDAAFRTQEHQPLKAERRKGASEALSSIAVTGRDGRRVQLLAAPGLLRRNEGLGWHIARRLQELTLPAVITAGEASLNPANLRKAAAACDRLVVLSAKDSGLLPGGLARDSAPGFEALPAELAGRTTVLGVQPDAVGGLAALDLRTTAALAEHIVREMIQETALICETGKTNS